MLTLNDGRSELWQWDTGRTLAVDADCSQVHFSNKVFGRSIDVDVVDGVAVIPDILLQTDKDLNVWAFVGTAENGYTKISKTFKVNRRNKPADYVFIPTEQMTLQMIQLQIGDLADLTTEAKDTLVAAINEAARTGGGAGSMDLRVADGYVQYSADGGMTWTNLIAMEDLKGDPGESGKDGHSPVVTATKSGKTTTISVDGAAIATVEDGADGKTGTDGADGVTPHIGDNGNWYLGETDTGKPSRGADGATGATGATGEKGADGKSAYAYAVEGGYTGTEAEFADKLAQEQLTGTTNDLTPTQVYDAVSAGIPVKVQYIDSTYGLLSFTAFNVAESLNVIVSQTIVYFKGLYILAELIGDKSGGTWAAMFATLAQKTDIPSALPNPNALTFTGAVTGSYDGSAPVTVNIPSGGSGGGALPNWRLIKTISISSEIASYDFNTDDNGDSFALKEVMLAGNVPAYSGYIYIKPKITGSQNAIWPTAGKGLRWWSASASGILKTMLAVSNAAVIWAADKETVCDNDTISRLVIGASSGFEADGTMYVYGR